MSLAQKSNGLFTLLCGMVLAACATDSAKPGTNYLVNTPRAEFFKYGPAQSFGADFVLPKGQRVILLERSFGFSRVMTEDGTGGWVASEDLVIAPPLPRPRTVASGKRRGSGGGSDRMYSGPRKGSNVQSVPDDPLFDMSDLPPLPEADPPKPKPNLRASPPKPN